MKYVKYLLYIYLFLRPYYLFDSGALQISDFFLLLAFVFLIIIIKKNKENKFVDIINENKLYLIFLFFVISINFIYFCFIHNLIFIKCTLFYIYNFLVIIIFSKVLNDFDFLCNMRKILKINIYIQLIIMLIGKGAYMYGARYMGTLNDPNQFAFYCMISCFLIYIITYILKDNKKNIIVNVVSLVLIICSISTGMLAAFLIYLSFVILKGFKIKKVIRKRTVFLIVTTLFLCSIIMYFFIFNKIDTSSIYSNVKNSNMYMRVFEKLNKIDNDNDSNLLYDRGYDKILKHPEYMLFGSGEGAFYRFEDCVNNEIHATIPSLLFYYGIIPTMILLCWIYKKLKDIPKSLYFIYIALFIESFTLINQRQSFFWIIILLGMILKNYKGDQNEKKKIC